LDVSAKITGIKYLPFLCRKLNTYSINNLNEALSKDGTFIVTIDEKKQLALSWWVSAKRTRSYPYARVYDSLSFQGKKVTLIPLFKDEGKEGDRDFLQWDTVSLMSLLNVYAIISLGTFICINEQILSYLSTLNSNVSIITIIGEARLGKSTFLTLW